MTDEEMARKYALERKKNLHLSQRDTNLIHLAYLHGLKDGKDNWHYPSEGDLPKVKGTWVIGFYYGKDNWHKLFYRADDKWWGEGQLCQPPYAWKEIVPPKEIEE